MPDASIGPTGAGACSASSAARITCVPYFGYWHAFDGVADEDRLAVLLPRGVARAAPDDRLRGRAAETHRSLVALSETTPGSFFAASMFRVDGVDAIAIGVTRRTPKGALTAVSLYDADGSYVVTTAGFDAEGPTKMTLFSDEWTGRDLSEP